MAMCTRITTTSFLTPLRGRRDHDRMLVEFTTTYDYHHYSCEFEPL
jgi:hypothetical protein